MIIKSYNITGFTHKKPRLKITTELIEQFKRSLHFCLV